ncbi:hypothetical protein C8Q74DRAFT_1363765 [Fomes fomentarius]|nr:hypothetical protein C8Q74DRAFT_1363765 [Fomes fomentarius]
MSAAPFDLETYLSWNLGITGTIFGVATGQVASYLRHYWREDRCTLKAAVGAVWTLDCLQMALYSYTVAHYLVYAHNDLVGQSKIAWTASGQTAVNATLIALVQLFYVLRVSALCRYPVVTVVLLLLVAACWGVSIMLVVKIILTNSVAALSDMKKYVALTNSLIAVTDIAISLTLVALLITSRTGGSRLKRLINRLIFYTINTGLLTSVLALLAIVTNLTKGDTLIYLILSYVGTSLYTVSMVASLNAREGLRNHMAGASGITTISTLTNLSRDRNLTVLEMQNSSGGAVRIPPAVFIETSVETAH